MKLVHLVGFITNKFVKMHGHMNVKFDFTLFTLYTPIFLMYFNVKCVDLQLTVFSFSICLYSFIMS